VIRCTGAKLDIPTAEFWYARDGKIQEQLPHRYDRHVRAGVRPSNKNHRIRTGPRRSFLGVADGGFIADTD
jgi:hypothetical protein